MNGKHPNSPTVPTTDGISTRQAILQAAEWIVAHPDLYDFGKAGIPRDGDCGCMLGWIGYFAGMEPKTEVLHVSSELLGLENEHGLHCSDPFYERIAPLVGKHGYQDLKKLTPTKAAKALRLYADKYYGDAQ